MFINKILKIFAIILSFVLLVISILACWPRNDYLLLIWMRFLGTFPLVISLIVTITFLNQLKKLNKDTKIALVVLVASSLICFFSTTIPITQTVIRFIGYQYFATESWDAKNQAIKNNDVNQCPGIGDLSYREECYAYFFSQINDPKQCDTITKEFSRDNGYANLYCYETIGVKTNNIEICEAMPTKWYSSVQVECYEKVIKELNDPSLCTDIDPPAEVQAQWWQERCLSLFPD